MPLLRRRTAALLAVTLSAPLSLSVVTATSSPAHADDDTNLTVVGTSDVQDSGLIDYLKPLFAQHEMDAFGKTVALKYVSQGTDAAIKYAQSGAASALIVHAASLENQFVAGGYSLEPYGRAFTWGDFVLLGPAGDPAGVMNGTDASQDIVDAFEKIAVAGAKGEANFVSRGKAPGTTVAEHNIWSVASADTVPGLTYCDVPSTNGGGKSPWNGTEPNGTNICGTKALSPSWYQVTNATQAPNVTAADACNTFDDPPKQDCYVFTDKGTYEYLVSQNMIDNLQVVAADNTAPGEENLLINSFHAYAINPAAVPPGSAINTTLATEFLDYLTSAEGQQAIADYLKDDATGIGPFRPSAVPTLASSSIPAPGGAAVTYGTKLTFTGSLTNETPGTPALANVPVKLMGVSPSTPDAVPTEVASGTTDENGIYSISYRPSRSLIYSVATDQITQTEVTYPTPPNPADTPPFVDLLQPASAQLGTVAIRGVVKATNGVAGGRSGFIRVNGKIAPTAPVGGKVQLYAARPGKALTLKVGKTLHLGDDSYVLVYGLGKGSWDYQVRYSGPGYFQTGSGVRKTITLK